MLRSTALLCFALVPALSASPAHAQNSQLYQRAIGEANGGDYTASCRDFQALYAATSKFRALPADVIASEKAMGAMETVWTRRGIESDRAQRWAQECTEFMHRGVNDAAFNDFYLVDDSRTYADRAIAHVQAAPGATTPASAESCSASTTSRAGTARTRPDPRIGVPPRQPAAAAPANLARVTQTADSVVSGSGTIPSGDYKCFTATTATLLAGGSASVNPGQFLTHIHINGNMYQAYEDPTGHYSIGANGKITWNGGTYSSKTLGRYVIDRGQPAIVIGYADTDAGSVCKR